jgi:hypothetical protein
MNRDELVQKVAAALYDRSHDGGSIGRAAPVTADIYRDDAELAINLILEEAARLAESLWVSTGLEGIERESGGHEVAAAIRALKGNSQ